MTHIEQLVTDYIAVWNETDPQRRSDIAARVFTPEATYVDPMVVAEGRSVIEASIAAVQDQFPGLTFRLAGQVDAHHDTARFTWHLGAADVPDLVIGFDVVTLSDDGRMATILGFLDKVPAAA